MPIKLKKNPNNAVIEELENIEQRIRLLNKLKNPELSDEEFLEILSLCYCYDISDLEEDVKANAKALFGVGDIKPVIIDTNLKLESGNYVRYDGYAPSFLKIKSLYTLSEIADLIKNHQLIIDVGVKLERSDDLKVFMTPEKQKEAESLIVSLKYFRNLGIYKDWFLTVLRREFTPDRVANDILCLINYARSLISTSKTNLESNINESLKRANESLASLEELRKKEVTLSLVLDIK